MADDIEPDMGTSTGTPRPAAVDPVVRHPRKSVKHGQVGRRIVQPPDARLSRRIGRTLLAPANIDVTKTVAVLIVAAAPAYSVTTAVSRLLGRVNGATPTISLAAGMAIMLAIALLRRRDYLAALERGHEGA